MRVSKHHETDHECSACHVTGRRDFVFEALRMGAIALAAIEMALAGITFAIPADEVIDTMGEIGRAMDVRYRETAGGGLAATPTGRRLAKERLVQIKRG